MSFDDAFYLILDAIHRPNYRRNMALLAITMYADIV